MAAGSRNLKKKFWKIRTSPFYRSSCYESYRKSPEKELRWDLNLIKRVKCGPEIFQTLKSARLEVHESHIV